MKCSGMKNPSKCLRCRYADCITDEYGNLPQYAVDRIERNRQNCREYYQRHREEIRAKRNTPEAKARKYENTLRWREKNHEKVLISLRKYHRNHREEQRRKQAEYYQKHKDEICERMRRKYWEKRGQNEH